MQQDQIRSVIYMHPARMRDPDKSTMPTLQTVAFMTAFIAAMTLFPHVQQCAQKEVDEHFEREKAPSPVDQASLPYVSALIKEVLRWAPPAPLGVQIYNHICIDCADQET